MQRRALISAQKLLAAPQQRSYRYRGQSDVDTETPWYWTPMESPNFSRLPLRYDKYMFQGYGQEQGKVFTNPSLYGEHQNMGRKQVTALGCLLGFMLISQFVYRAPELGDAIMTRDSYVVSQQYYDFLKQPFDNMFLYLAMSTPYDKEYVKHINSKDTI